VRNEEGSRRRGIFYIKYTEGTVTGLVTAGVGTACINILIEERYREGQK
jgi:hypothetical protein